MNLKSLQVPSVKKQPLFAGWLRRAHILSSSVSSSVRMRHRFWGLHLLRGTDTRVKRIWMVLQTRFAPRTIQFFTARWVQFLHLPPTFIYTLLSFISLFNNGWKRSVQAYLCLCFVSASYLYYIAVLWFSGANREFSDKTFFFFFSPQEITTLQDKIVSQKCQIQQNFTEIHFKAQNRFPVVNLGELQNRP